MAPLRVGDSAVIVCYFLVVLIFFLAKAFCFIGVSLAVTIALVLPSSKSSLLIKLLSSSSLVFVAPFSTLSFLSLSFEFY